MSAMKALVDEFHAVVAKLEAEGHHLADQLKQLVAALTGDLPALEQQAAAAATQVAHDAEAAASPVIAEAEKDAVKVVGQAEATVIADVTKTTGA